MEFKSLKNVMKQSFNNMVDGKNVLFLVDVDRELLWETYLNSFKDETVKQSNNCNCCKSFIRQYGNIVTIKTDNTIETIWNFLPNLVEGSEYYDAIRDLNQLILNNCKIKDVFISESINIGTDISTVKTENGEKITWDHFALKLPKIFVNSSSKSVDSIISIHRDNKNVFKRSLEEITLDSLETVNDLIKQNSLYKGEEFSGLIIEFTKLKKIYDKLKEVDKDNFCWLKSYNLTPAISKIKNTSIGTLLIDISEGKELDNAVSAYERIVAPNNYKRPNAIVTNKMLTDAEKDIDELGMKESLKRRFAIPEDIDINNLLFVNRNIKKASNIFDELKEDSLINSKTLSKIEEVTIDKFITDILPTLTSVDLLLENNHLNNLMTIITEKEKNSPLLFKWNNPFSWYYTNGVTDSMKERVKEAGGKVDGVLRFTIQWNEDKKSICDLDAHAKEPNGEHIYFSNFKGCQTKQSGTLDVDMINPTNVGIENITWSDISKMKKGNYEFWVNNYNSGRNSGFKAQIEFNNQIFDFSYNSNAVGNIKVANVIYGANGFELIPILESINSIVSKDKWNMSTNKLQKVSMIMKSPNYWGDNEIGNKHFMFILENAKNDEPVRGFFNEFLKEELVKKHKRSFELIGGKIKVEEPIDNNKELSGVGFSSTQRNYVICKVEGKFSRYLKISF